MTILDERAFAVQHGAAFNYTELVDSSAIYAVEKSWTIAHAVRNMRKDTGCASGSGALSNFIQLSRGTLSGISNATTIRNQHP